MDKNSNSFTLLFAVSVCVVLAVLLASAYNGMLDRIKANAAFDRQTNILIAVGLYDRQRDAGKSRAELEELFRKYIRSQVLEVERDLVTEEVMQAGDLLEQKVLQVTDILETDHDVADLPNLLREERRKPDPAARREFVPFYTRVDDQGKPVVYCIPISGYGLWSTLYGYLALGDRVDEVRGITFYQHGETPGLGGEVDNPGWQKQWQGKRIRDDHGKLVGIVVKKGQVLATDAMREHMVDGLSGATITSNGVTRFVRRDLEMYESYFQKLRNR